MPRTSNLDRHLLTTIRTALASLNVTQDALLVVAVSGGPDSVCLLHALTRLPPTVRPRLHVAHLDHGLRGAGSASDARFVRDVAVRWGLPATIERRTAGSSENAARQARYNFLTGVAADLGAAAVAVAHTAGDQAETVLLHLLRGAGLTGLAGMAADSAWRDPAGRAIRIIRPLLGIWREDIQAYCRLHNLSPRQDPTNESPRFTRNRIRHQLLPQLRTYNPRIDDALVRLARLAADEEAYWETETAKRWAQLAPQQNHGELRLPIAGLQEYPAAVQRRLLRKALTDLCGLPQVRSAGFSPSVPNPGAAQSSAGHVARGLVPRPAITPKQRDTHLDAGHTEQLLRLLDAGAGRRASLPAGIEAETEAGVLILRTILRRPAIPALPDTILPVPGVTGVGVWRVTVRLGTPPEAIGPDRWTAQLDAGRLPGALLLRSRRPGDRYRPTGMPAQKKLQDILVDAKVPQRLRDAVPVLESGGAIVWLGGFRVSEDARLTPHTSKAIEVVLEPLSDEAQRLVEVLA